MHARAVIKRAGNRWRWWLADYRSAKVCLALVIVIAVIHGVLALLHLTPDSYVAARPPAGVPEQALAMEDGLSQVYRDFGLSRGGLAKGEIWQLLTHAFLHGDLAHLLINSAGLLLLGARIERIAGATAVLKIFFAGVLLGGVAQLLLASDPEFLLVGASGGIAAMLLWLTSVSPEARAWPIPVSGKNLGRGLLASEAGFVIASWIFPQWGLSGVAHACHLGGAVAGLALGRLELGPSLTLEELKKERARRESADEPLKPS